MDSNHTHIVLYDGLCGFCSRSVQFILNRDPGAVFSYAPLQSEIGRGLLAANNLSVTDLNSVVLVADGRAYQRSTAALRILKDLKSPLKIFYPLVFLPEWLRDPFYNIIAHNRYRLFGKLDQCMIPPPEVRSRFIG